MEFFLPSLLLMFVAFFTYEYVTPNFSLVGIAILAIVLLVFSVYNHYATFSGEYNIMQWASSAQQIAPTLLTGLVILIVGGYIIYMFSSGNKTPGLSMPPANIPPPQTATNIMTRGIGNGLLAMGATNVSKSAGRPGNSPIANTALRGVAESVLDKGV
jgi:hypothetical protein